MVSEPKTDSGLYKRRLTEAMEEISGVKYCTSCGTLKPREQVKLYRGVKTGVIPRCDDCQSRRVAWMKERKAA